MAVVHKLVFTFHDLCGFLVPLLVILFSQLD